MLARFAHRRDRPPPPITQHPALGDRTTTISAPSGANDTVLHESILHALLEKLGRSQKGLEPAADDVQRAVRHERRAQERALDQIIAERVEAHGLLERGSLRRRLHWHAKIRAGFEGPELEGLLPFLWLKDGILLRHRADRPARDGDGDRRGAREGLGGGARLPRRPVRASTLRARSASTSSARRGAAAVGPAAAAAAPRRRRRRSSRPLIRRGYHARVAALDAVARRSSRRRARRKCACKWSCSGRATTRPSGGCSRGAAGGGAGLARRAAGTSRSTSRRSSRASRATVGRERALGERAPALGVAPGLAAPARAAARARRLPALGEDGESDEDGEGGGAAADAGADAGAGARADARARARARPARRLRWSRRTCATRALGEALRAARVRDLRCAGDAGAGDAAGGGGAAAGGGAARGETETLVVAECARARARARVPRVADEAQALSLSLAPSQPSHKGACSCTSSPSARTRSLRWAADAFGGGDGARGALFVSCDAPRARARAARSRG